MAQEESVVRLDRITRRMAELDIDSDRELARRADVDNATVSLLRSGKRPNIAAPTLAKIAKALHCSTSFLLGETEMLLPVGIVLADHAEDVLRIMEQLPEDLNAEIHTHARAVAASESRRAERAKQALEKANQLVGLVGPEEAARILPLVLRAAVDGDWNPVAAELSRWETQTSKNSVEAR